MIKLKEYVSAVLLPILVGVAVVVGFCQLIILLCSAIQQIIKVIT